MPTSTEFDQQSPSARPDPPPNDYELTAAVQALQSEHEVVVAYWIRDEITVTAPDGSTRPVTDLEWADISSKLPDRVYDAVGEARCLQHAAQQALVWAADPSDRQHLHQVLPDVDALDPAALQAWSSEQRWHQTCQDLDPRLTSDPHYPALVQALDRAEAAGADVQNVLADAVTAPLPDEHTGRVLHSRLVLAHPAAATPAPVLGPTGVVRSPAGPPPPRAAARPAPRL